MAEKCGYIITLNGEQLKDKDGKIVVFDNDADLDAWIYEHRDMLLSKDRTFDVISEIPIHEQIIRKILDNSAQAANISPENKIDTTRLWENIDAGGDEFAKRKAYEKIAIESIERDLGLSEEKAREKYEEEQKEKGTVAEDRGTDFHNILEDKLKKQTLRNNKKGVPLNSSEYEPDRLTADAFIRHLNHTFGEGKYHILTEQKIYNSNLESTKREALIGLLGAVKSFNTIIGIPDLMVITDSGEIHIYDYKTSHMPAPSDWYMDNYQDIKNEGSYSPFRRREIEAQLWTYVAMLKSLGFKNVYAHVAKFKRATDGSDKDKIVAFEKVFDLRESGNIVKNIYGLFNIDITAEVEDLKKNNTEMSELFGDNSSVSKQSEGFKRNSEYFMSPDVQFLKKVDPESEKGKEGYTWFFTSMTGDLVYIKGSREEARPKVEAEVKLRNNAASSESLRLGNDLLNIKSRDELKSLAKQITKTHFDEMQRVFEKYIVNGWTLNPDKTLLGNGIFLFQRGDRSEIVMIETADGLHGKVKLDRGTSILGNFFYDDEFGTDNRFYLEATVGNMLLMKAVSFAASKPDFFKLKKLTRITAFNPLTGETVNNTPLSQLANNWRTLSFLKRSLNLRDISDLIYSDSDAAIACARDYISILYGYDTNLQLFKLPKSEVDYTEAELLEILNNLKWVYKDDEAADWRIKLAYGEIYKALLYIHGNYHITTEQNVGEYLNGGLSFNGGFVSPFAISPSANLRTINAISITYHNKIAQDAHKIVAPWQQLLKSLWGDEFKNPLGGEWSLFTNWFKQDAEGNIDASFSLKDPRTDEYFIQRPEEAKLCKYFLDEIAKLRWGDDWESKTDTDEYLEVPLVEPASNWEILESNKLGQGLYKVTNKKIRNIKEVAVETIVGNRQNTNYYEDEKEQLNIDKIPNYFFTLSRQQRADKLADKRYGPGYFEKNLDIVFLSTIFTGVKSKLSTTFMPLFTGMRALLAIENNFNKAQMQSIAKAVDAYVGSVVLNKSLVPRELRRLNQIIGELKGLVSKLSLGLSSKNYVRELSGSAIRTAFEAFSKDPRFSNSFTFEEYSKALGEMMVSLHEAFISNSKDVQLNTKFRAANMSFFEMAKNLRSGKYGIKNVEDDFWFQTSTLPDFVHRLAVLKATLIHEGAYDAYVMKDGILEYDWTKDKRFDMLFKYAKDGKLSETDYTRIKDSKDLAKWSEQNDNYKRYLANWAQAGEYLKYGQPLPEALTPDQQQTFKTQTDILYGNYDNESKSLMQRTLLGSMFFQFKTFGISRMMEWWKNGGAINIMLPHDMVDPTTKERIFERLSTEAEMMMGKPKITYILESEITEDDRKNNRVRPVREVIGAYHEGRVQTAFAYLIAMSKPEELERLWKDPFKRANAFNAIHDLWLWVLLAGLVRLLYGDEIIETMNEQDWWTRWTYAVVMGIAQDGPIWEIAKSLWSNGEIPMISALSKYISTGMSVINGNTYVWNGVLNTFGATREFSNLIDAM